MPNYLQVQFSTDFNGFSYDRQGFTISSDPPDSGSVDYTRVWVRNRLSFSKNFQTSEQWAASTPSGTVRYANVNEIYMGPVKAVIGLETGSTGKPFVYIDSFFSQPVDQELYTTKPTGSFYGNNEPGYTQIFSYVPREIIFSGRPVDIIVQLGAFSGVGAGGRIWIGPAGGPYTQFVSGTVVNNTYTGSIKFYDNRLYPHAVTHTGYDQVLRLFQWEVVDAITHSDPFNVSTVVSSFTGSLTGLQIIGDDFSGYSNKEEFQLSVNNSTTTNAAYFGTYYNPNYYSYFTGIGFYDNAFDFIGPSGSVFEFLSTPLYFPWRCLVSSSNSTSTDAPFGSGSVWQLCNPDGTRVSPVKLAQYISGSWNTGSVQGVPALGIFEYTSSVNSVNWMPNSAGGTIRHWATYPGAYVDGAPISMSLKSLVNATFDAPIPSGAFGASVSHSNYGFYPISPLNVSSSIFDIL